MRITNKIMQRNNLNNINTNKVYQDSLSTQMSTQKKISRASDDPVVAIRALRLRSNVTEVTQFYSKNIPDARSWLEVTESALKNQSQVMTDMISQCTKGANGDLTSEDRGIILDQLQALAKEVYSTANADYAGRYVFTGYRTDTPLSFVKAQEQTYEIKEQLDRNALSTVNKVESGNVSGWTSANYETLDKTDEQSVEAVQAYRIQLAYSECSETVSPTIRYRDADGKLQEIESTIMHTYETDPSAYKAANDDDDAVIYVPETGEVLFGKNQYQKLMEVKDDVSTSKDEGQIQVIYQKDTWLSGDLRPEHYFYCKSDPGTENEIEYNNSLKNGKDEIYNSYVSERDAKRKAVDAIAEKYPDVPLKSAKALETIENDTQKLADLDAEIAALEAEKAADGTSADRIEEIDERLSAIADEQTKLNDEIEACKNYVPDPNKDQLVVEPEYMEQLEQQIQDKQNEITTLETEKSGLEAEKTGLEDERTALYDEQDALELRKELLGMTQEELEEEKTNLTDQSAALQTQSDDLDAERDALQAELEAEDTTDERKAEIETRLEEIYLEKSHVNDRLEANATRAAAVDDRLAEMSDPDALSDDEITAAIDARMGEISDRVTEINDRIEEIDNRTAEIDEELGTLNAELDALSEEKNDLDSFNADWERIQFLTEEITFMDGDYENQAIEYDVGFNQTIRVNSTAGECFQHGIGRTVDDIVTALQEVTELDNIKTKIKKALDAAQEGTDAAKTLKAQYQAADKAVSLAKDKTQKMFESAITTFQKYLDDVSLSITNCGNRSKKLELIENRMQEQKTTFETLRSENEDVDIAETAIQLTSAQLTYEAALMATGKVSQNSLLQYI